MLVLNPFTHDTRVLKEARSLASAGFGVTVWALKIDTVPAHEDMHGFRVKRLKQESLSLPLRPPGLVYAETISKATIHLVREDADVYHAHDAKALPACYLASRLRNVPLIYDAHEFLLDAGGTNRRSRLRSQLWRFFEKLWIRRTQAVITVNVSIAEELARLHDVEPTVLMNSQEYVDLPKSNILREELGIADEKHIILYPGILAHGRGLEQLVASAQYLTDDTVIVLMGDDRLDGKLQQLTREMDVEDRIRFRAAVAPEQVPRYVASADIGVMPTQAVKPSYVYGSGNKLFHYVMAGIPSAVSDQPEKRRIVETYDVGAVFDETDPRSIAQTINDLVADKDRYRQMCRNAKEAARAELNWGVEELKLIRLYRSLPTSL
jgi:glycosyltransferase involved in cell wall biosynthesis